MAGKCRHVTDATESTVQVRALMSAGNSGNLFELRCYIRENLIKFINDNLGESLPKNWMMIGTETGLKPEVADGKKRK